MYLSPHLYIPSCGGGSGLFLACEDLWENIRPFIPLLRFLCVWRLACALLFQSLGQDQSTGAHQAETIVAECSLMSCM